MSKTWDNFLVLNVSRRGVIRFIDGAKVIPRDLQGPKITQA